MIIENIIKDEYHDKKIREVVISNHGQEYTITSCFEGIKIEKKDARNKMFIIPSNRNEAIIA